MTCAHLARPLLLGALALLLASSTAAQEVRVYRPTHRTAAELLPLAHTALGDTGRVSLDAGTNSLVLAGPKPRLDAALALLAQQDVARRMVLLRFASRELEELEASGIHVEWNAGGGRFRIGNTTLPAARLGSKAYRSGRERIFEGSVRVLEGEVATLARGREVPVQSRNLFGHGTVVFTGSDQGFLASPRILGDGRIQVRIAPTDSRTDVAGRSELLSAATTVILKPGETIAIGGTSRRHDSGAASVGRKLSTRQRDEERVLLLTVSIDQ